MLFILFCFILLLVCHIFSIYSIFLIVILGCNPVLRLPGSIPSSNSHTNLATGCTKKNKTARAFTEYPPQPYETCDNNNNNNNNNNDNDNSYNNSHNQHLHDYDHDSYNGGTMLRANESNGNNNNNNNNNNDNDNNHNNNNSNNTNPNNVNDNSSSSGSNNYDNNNQNGQNGQEGNNGFSNPNIYQTFNSYYDDVHTNSIDENGNKIPPKNDLNFSRINDDRNNEVNKIKNLDKNNIIYDNDSPSNFSNQPGMKKIKSVRKVHTFIQAFFTIVL